MFTAKFRPSLGNPALQVEYGGETIGFISLTFTVIDPAERKRLYELLIKAIEGIKDNDAANATVITR